MKYISDSIEFEKASKGLFNIVASGCGTGKTHWVANEVRESLPHIKASEMLFITSRSLIVEQQARNDNITRYNRNNVIDIQYWNGQRDSVDEISKKGIQIMTYDKIIDILKTKNAEGFETLGKVKVIFLDECHTLFSDTFIKDMEALKVWLRDTINLRQKYIIGLTATPRIVFFYQKEWGVSVQQLNKDILVNYSAKQLWCTDYDTLHFLLANREIQGKTMVMCYSISDCYKLKSRIPNSFVLVSKSNNKNYMPEMDEVRDYIIENESLPETYLEVFKRDGKKPLKYERRNLEVLISTSTMREGINIREDSGVKNMVICFTDELHISQWIGRCRYNVENLIVAETNIRTDNYNQSSYLAKSRSGFKEYMSNENNTRWFDSIAHLVNHDFSLTLRFKLNNKEKMFTEYINKKWLVPSGVTGKSLDKYKIYKKEDKDEIVKKVIDYKLIDNIYTNYITFNRVMNFMRNTLGYEIEDGRIILDKQRYTYKLIVDFDEEVIVEKEEDKDGKGDINADK